MIMTIYQKALDDSQCSPRHSRKKHWSLGETKLNVSRGQVIICFVIPPNSNMEKTCKDIVCLTPAGSPIFSGSKEHNLIKCKPKVHVVVSEGSWWVLRQRYVKGSPPIGKCIWVGRYNKTLWYRRVLVWREFFKPVTMVVVLANQWLIDTLVKACSIKRND